MIPSIHPLLDLHHSIQTIDLYSVSSLLPDVRLRKLRYNRYYGESPEHSYRCLGFEVAGKGILVR